MVHSTTLLLISESNSGECNVAVHEVFGSGVLADDVIESVGLSSADMGLDIRELRMKKVLIPTAVCYRL